MLQEIKRANRKARKMRFLKPRKENISKKSMLYSIQCFLKIKSSMDSELFLGLNSKYIDP